MRNFKEYLKLICEGDITSVRAKMQAKQRGLTHQSHNIWKDKSDVEYKWNEQGKKFEKNISDFEKNNYYEYYGKPVKYIGKSPEGDHIFYEEGVGKSKISNNAIDNIKSLSGKKIKIKFKITDKQPTSIIADNIDIGTIQQDTEPYDDGRSNISYGSIRIYRITINPSELFKIKVPEISLKWKVKPSTLQIIEILNKSAKENKSDQKYKL